MTPALLALLLWTCPPAAAQTEDSWAFTETQHFVIRHQGPSVPLAEGSLLERIYAALHPELWRLVPWMTREKTTVYLYKDGQSYGSGRFQPPAWSRGLLGRSNGRPVLATYEPADASIIAHELAHLYFHSYFGEKSARPPAWLDEGLAGMLQDEALAPADSREKGPVLSAGMPLSQFFRSRPAEDAPANRVSDWYRQAHSVVRFIKRGHIELSFSDFCSLLRDGETPEAALKKVYGYADAAAFEAAWHRWRPKKAMGQPLGLHDQ